MLPIEKNQDIVDQIKRVNSRADHFREVKDQLFRFINNVQKLNGSFSQKISREMTKFEQFVVKNSLYYEKTDHIVNLSKLYREFSIQIQRNSKINLINIQAIKQEHIQKLEEKLKAKCKKFVDQFSKYIVYERDYNGKYTIYSQHCDQLNKIILRNKSYQNPIAFYNKILTSQYLSELDEEHQQCSSSQTQIITSRQVIDQKRGALTELIKDVNQNYFLFVYNYLDIIQKIIKCIVYPKNEGKIQKTELNLKMTSEKDKIQEQQLQELQRLQNLYASDGGKAVEGNPFQQFSQLFRKSVGQNQISSDYRFFYDRCDSIRNKKLKTSEQTFKIQTYLYEQLKLQRESYYTYQKEYKQIQKDTYTNNGVESYKKRFRKYFGSNFAEIFQLCLSLIERQKKSLEKICKNMEEGQQKMKKILESKRETIAAFEKRSKVILQDHLKIKERTQSKDLIDSDQLSRFKTSITQSFNELKKVFLQLQKSQRQDDKRFFSNLKSLYETIMKQATNKNLNKLLEKQKNRINILNNIYIDRQTLSILKEDSRYENLLNECPKPNLYDTFVTLISKKDIQQTRTLLQKKEGRLKNMIKQKQGCCGVKSEVIKQKVHSQHDCKLRNQNQKYKGTLFISELGLIFEQSVWNPFAEGLQLIIPQSDIVSFDIKKISERQVVQIMTEFGALAFDGKENLLVLQSMQKNITFKPIKQASERGLKRNDSSSFIKNNTSTEFKMSYDKSLNSNGDLSRIIKATGFNHPQQKVSANTANKPKSLENQLKDLIRKWKEGQFLSEQRFTKVVRDPADKNDMRRDYQYRQGHSKFYLKERKGYKMVEKDLILKYEWKISFPDSPMLHSFKHHQEIRLENIAKELRIRVITAKYYEEQLYIKNKFYKEIEQMNTLVCKFILYVLEKDADIINEQEYDERKSLESYNIVLDQINLEERESRFQRTESMMRTSKIERMRGSLQNARGSKTAL